MDLFLSYTECMQMESAVRRSTGKNKDGSEVFDWFEKYVLRSKLDVSIDHLELVSFSKLTGDEC